MASDIVLSARKLGKRFGGVVAVDGVDLDVARGSIHSIIGPNGAGKTTFFNLLTKFYKPTSGTIEFAGKDITGLSAPDVARRGIVRSFQISAVFLDLTVIENIRLALQRRRGGSFDFWRSGQVLRPFEEEAAELAGMVGLADFIQRRAAELSYGRKRALEIATTLALKPEIMLLDEPMAGMGREDISQITKLLAEVRTGRTILMVEHNLSVVAELSDRITVLARGRVIADGDYDTVSKDPVVIEAYIGTGDDD